MARIVARNACILVDGRDVSARSNNVAYTFTVEAPEATAFTESTRVRLTGGLGDQEMTIDGFWDSAASSTDEYFSGLLGASGLWAFIPAGLTACNKAREFTGILSEYSSTAGVADALQTSVTVSGCQPTLYSQVLAASNYAGTGASVAGAGVDFGGSTALAYATFRYISGTGVITSARWQDSANDSTWVTLSTFASLSVGNTVSMISSSAARYRRFKWQIASGSAANIVVTCGSSLM